MFTSDPDFDFLPIPDPGSRSTTLLLLLSTTRSGVEVISFCLNVEVLSDQGDKAGCPGGKSPVAEAEEAGTGEPVVRRIRRKIRLCAGGQAHQGGQALLQFRETASKIIYMEETSDTLAANGSGTKRFFWVACHVK